LLKIFYIGIQSKLARDTQYRLTSGEQRVVKASKIIDLNLSPRRHTRKSSESSNSTSSPKNFNAMMGLMMGLE